MKKHNVVEGTYFFHKSFLIELAENWIQKGEIGVQAKLFMLIVTTSISKKEMISCNRTLEEINKQKYSINFVPGCLDLIEEKSLKGDKFEAMTDEEYSFNVASVKGISNLPTFFIVPDSQKGKIQADAFKLKFKSLTILSPEDFHLECGL
ncbi:MAG: hypothetical protein ABIJ18_02765 [archaeon]